MIYLSQLTGAELISAVKEELGLSPLPPDAAFVRWLTSAEQLLWSEVVCLRAVAAVEAEGESISLSGILPGTGEDEVCAADICAVYYGAEAAREADAEQAMLFSGDGLMWYRSDEREITVTGAPPDASLSVVYLVRPQKRSGALSAQTARVALPDEFCELAASKLRGEAYRLSGEDAQAAKWFSDYNAKLESFAAWCERRRPGGAR